MTFPPTIQLKGKTTRVIEGGGIAYVQYNASTIEIIDYTMIDRENPHFTMYVMKCIASRKCSTLEEAVQEAAKIIDDDDETKRRKLNERAD